MSRLGYVPHAAVGCGLGLAMLYSPVFPVGGLAAVLSFLIFLRKPQYTFLLWLLVFPLFSTLTLLQIGIRPVLTFDRLFITGLVVILLVRAIRTDQRLLSLDRAEWMLVLFSSMVVYSAISHAHSEFAHLDVVMDRFVIPFAVYALGRHFITSDKDISYFFGVVVLMGVYTSFLGIYEHFTLRDILPIGEGLAERSGWVRINGPYNQDASFGTNVMLALLALIGGGLNLRLVGKSKPLTKIQFALCLSVMGAALFFNYYRTIWLSTLAGLAVWVLMKRRRIWYLIPVALICLLILVSYMRDFTSSEFFVSRVANVGTIEWRQGVFAVAFRQFMQHPVSGIGIFNLFRIDETRAGAHNTYLSLLGEMGAPGLAVYAMLMLLVSFQAYKNYTSPQSPIRRKAAGIFLCSLTAYLMAGMSLLIGYQAEINNLFFALAGVAASKPFRDKISAGYHSH